MGISYEVVTKVKEYTEARRYGEILDLLEGEDIFQSLNPQFLRCCGEVYLENNRFYESREALVRAHVMAPEGNRIIYDLVHLYLKMGYFQRAKQYYEIYTYNAGLEDAGKLYLQYMIQKAQRVDAGELVGILEKACEEQYSDEWGFELALLYASLGKQDKMKEECVHLIASFRESPYCALAESLKKGEYDVNNSNFCFPIMEAKEDVELYKAILEIEEKQLEKDELKVHPPEPVIIQMEDDDGTEELEEERSEKTFGIKLPFGKKAGKIADIPNDQDIEDGKNEETVAGEENQALQENTTEGTELGERNSGSEDIAAYIEEIMKSVADIEASIAEDLQDPLSFQRKDASVMVTGKLANDSKEKQPETYASALENEQEHMYSSDLEERRTETLDEEPFEEKGIEEKGYQSKLFEVEESLSPKERLEQLMKLIEEDKEEEVKGEEQNQESAMDEEVELDEFLMDLVGASAITQAMVKTYRDERDSEKWSGEDIDQNDGKEHLQKYE